MTDLAWIAFLCVCIGYVIAQIENCIREYRKIMAVSSTDSGDKND